MPDHLPRRTGPQLDVASDRLLLAAGAAFGLVYGASFALLTWGYDAVLLCRYSAHLAWGKLILGLPLAVVVCTYVGWRGVRASPWLRFLGIWPLAGAALGAFAAQVLPGLSNVLVWLADRRFAQLPIYPYGRPDPVRSGFLTVVQIILGASVGLAQNLAIDWAWDRAVANDRLGWRSWLVMGLCLPLALLPAIAVNEIVYKPLRAPQQAMVEYLEQVGNWTGEQREATGVSANVIRGFEGKFSERYTTHLVGFDPDSEAWFGATIDTVFDNEVRIRCQLFGDNVVHCEDLSAHLREWMSALISLGVGDGQDAASLESSRIALGERVAGWLSTRGPNLDGPYEVSVAGQHGGWILVDAAFESGFRMGCYLRSTGPVVVDYCTELAANPNP